MALTTVIRPCYVTREEVKRALDVKASAYSYQQIDRKLNSASDTVDGLCQRHFYPVDATYTFDWPNYQYAYPWVLWLDQHELAAQPTLVESGFYLSQPVRFPAGSYICQPVNDGPPFTSIELRRDMTVSFGNNTTPQNDIGITGSFGYWLQTIPVGTIVSAITSAQTSVQTSAGPLAGADVGDVLFVDGERMLVTDCNFVSTGITPVSGCVTEQKSDATLVVPDGTQFSKGEILLYDSECLLVQNIIGNNILVKRAYDGTSLSTHGSSILSANRLLTVNRGQLGTPATAHNQGAVASVNEVPGLAKEVAIATAVIGMTNEPAAYSVQTTASWYGSNARMNSSQREAAPGVGYQGLLAMLEQSILVRKARTRVI